MRVIAMTLLLGFSIGVGAFGQARQQPKRTQDVKTSSVLDNSAIVKLVKSGFSPDTIITIVDTQPGKYSLAVGDMLSLKQAGVPESVISAMARKNTKNTEQVPSPKTAETSEPTNVLAKPELKIMKENLVQIGNFYGVKGIIYNPNDKAVKNVRVNYRIWKKWMGKDGHGLYAKENGGLVWADINYIPPKTSVEFFAQSDYAAVMTPESGLLPDPLEAEIEAEWDK